MGSSRRQLLKAAGVTALGLGVAGCAGESNDTGPAGSAGGDSEGDTRGTTKTATADDAITENETAETTETDTATETEPTTETDSDVEGTVTDDSDAPLQIVEHHYYRDGDAEGVRGTVENTSDRAFSYVEVHLAPKNEKEETLDRFQVDSQGSIDSLGPGETWEFDVEIEGEFEFTRYDIWVTGRTDG